MVTPAAHREAAGYLRQTYEMSKRRACRVIGGDRSSVRYQAVRPDDGVLRERLKALAQERRSQAGDRHAQAAGNAAGGQPALEPGLRVRPVHRRPPVPDP